MPLKAKAKAVPLIAAEAPTPLALSLRQFEEETESFRKLHRLIDAIEVFTKLHTVLVVSDLFRHAGFRGDEETRGMLAVGLKTPSLGIWWMFAREFAHVDAIDFSARFIRSGVRLQDGGELHYEVPIEGDLNVARSVSLDGLGLAGVGDRVAFTQGDACNLKSLYTDYDLVFAGNLIDRLYDPSLFLDLIGGRVLPGGLLVITSPYTWLEEYTPKSKWLGGRREHGEPLGGFDGLSRILEERFELVDRIDVPFVIRETARKHQHSIAEMTVWRRLAPPRG